MTFLTLVVAVLNVCLGYALAVQMGYGTAAPEADVDEPTGFDDSLAWDESDHFDDLDGGLDDLDDLKELASESFAG